MSAIVEKIETAVDVIERLQNAGFEAVFAGGAVRDFILGVEPNDIDIATSATPEQVEALFEKTVAVGKAFGVIRVLHDEEEFEVATFRKDSKQSDGRRPDSVEFSSMEEDAKRRDLTINAIFFDPINDKIHDFVGGQLDIKARRIAFVGNPQERIDEDKLRILRVVRFAARGGWHIEKKTSEAVVNNASQVATVSRERIADELTKILTHKNAWLGFRDLLNAGLWPHLIPEIQALNGCTQDSKWHPEGDVFMHTQLMLKNAGEKLVGNKLLAWAIVLHDIAKPHTWADAGNGKITAHGHAEVGAKVAREILEGLRFDTKTIDAIVWLVENHMKMFAVKEMKQATRMKLIANENFDNLLELHRLDCLSSNGDLGSHDFIVQVRASTPASQIKPERLIDGADVMACGLAPGKKVGKILAEIGDEQREGRITTKEQALEFVRGWIQQDEEDQGLHK